jgi:glycosyltransferase involved in cell wall biosynthesis
MTRPLKALFVGEGALGMGVMGHARATETLTSGLAETDVDATFIVLPPMGRLTRVLTQHVPLLGRLDLDLQTTRWHVLQGLRARRLVRDAIRRARPDVLHVHTHTLAFLMAREMQHIPTFVTVDATVADWHAMSIWRSSRSYSRALLAPSRLLERQTFATAESVLAFTDWARRAVRRECPGARTVEHHPGIDLVRFRPGPRSERPRPRLLFVGGRFEEKGGTDLIEAIGPLIGRELDLDVVTPDAVVAHPGVRVHRLQPQDPLLPELHRQADVFCLPTRGDAAPWVILEAMASGTAIVTTDVGGIRGLLGDGTAGRLVPRGDARQLRESILSLARDGAARRELGARARARCEARYDVRIRTRELVDLMQGAVPSRRDR